MSNTPTQPMAGYLCETCGVRYVEQFLIPHEIWAKHISPTGDDRGHYCVRCADTMLRRAGFKLMWYGALWGVIDE